MEPEAESRFTVRETLRIFERNKIPETLFPYRRFFTTDVFPNVSHFADAPDLGAVSASSTTGVCYIPALASKPRLEWLLPIYNSIQIHGTSDFRVWTKSHFLKHDTFREMCQVCLWPNRPGKTGKRWNIFRFFTSTKPPVLQFCSQTDPVTVGQV